MTSDNLLRSFLRSRRAQLTPAEVGLPPHRGVRHGQGLRREDVAQLAGVSVDYYARLEQGRAANYSQEVLDAVARALRLGPDDRSYLLDLVGRRPARRGTIPERVDVRPGLARILTSLKQNPAFVVDHRIDVLAANPLAHALFDDFQDGSTRAPNFARYVYLSSSARQLFGAWETTARITAGTLRRQLGRHPDDTGLQAVVDELGSEPTFARFWTEHYVVDPRHSEKTYRHAVVGELLLDCDNVTLPGDVDQILTIHTAAPGSSSEQVLVELGGLTKDYA